MTCKPNVWYNYGESCGIIEIFSWLRVETPDLGGNDLFDNAQSIKRILCPASNAFSQYNSILHCVKSMALSIEDVLILVALGPAATVLAYDLAKDNIQSIDVGHIDIEYEWFKMKAKSKVNIASKAVNEVNGGLATERIDDKKYYESIIAEIN